VAIAMHDETDTKERLLNAAEALFARHGCHATSVRAITHAAGANLAAVGYHFGSKEALIRGVIDRRLAPLNRERLARMEAELEAATTASRRPRVATLLRAFIEPTVRFRTTDPKGRDFIAFVARLLHEPEPGARDHFFARMRPVIKRYLPALCAALPKVAPEVIQWRFHFCIGAMAHTLFVAVAPPVAGHHRPTALDGDALVTLLVTFLTAGMKAHS